MDAKDFYYLAQQLHGDDKTEATYREVISLSYYTCFHLAESLAENRTAKPANMGMHKQLCQALIDYGQYNQDKLEKSLARQFYRLGLMLDDARKNRTSASYHLNGLTITQKDAESQLIAVQSIMQLIDQINQSITP